MAWLWSHTQEAYQNAFENLYKLSRSDLEIIRAEIRASNNNLDCPELDVHLYLLFMKNACKVSTDSIIEFIWGFMEELRMCDNGGHNAWCCPYGCHTVPFDKIKD